MPPYPPYPAQQPAAGVAYGYGPEDQEKPIDYKYYWYLFVKNFYVILTFFIIAITLAFIYTSKIPKQYKASAQVIVERPANAWKEDDNKSDDSQMSGGFQSEYYETQMAIITGAAVFRQVVQELKLDTYFELKEDEVAIQKLRNMVKVERVEDSRIFIVSSISSDPVLAANISNAVSRAYIRKNFEDMLYYSREILNWLPQEGSDKEVISVKDPMGGMKQMTREQLINSLPSIRTDATLRKLVEHKSTIESNLQLLLKQYREKHPKIIKERASVKFVDDSIQNEKSRIIDGLRAKAEGKLNVSQARILEEAQVPRMPLPSTKNKIILQVAFIELILSCLLIFIMDYFDDTIHSMEDLERKGIVLPFLGPLPLVKDRSIFSNKKGIIALHENNSEIAESFRYLRVSINFSASPDALKALVLSSCLPHEGKSFTSHNIAVSLALDGNRTLLVDADLRRPTLHRVFKVDNSSGLSNFLTSKVEFESIVKRSQIEDLFLVTSGPNSPNPASILASDRMKEFVAAAKDHYDRVIIDCPPLTGLGDGYVVGGMMGHIILVIAAGRSPIDLIKHTQGQLAKSGINVIGVALNMVDMDKERHHGYSRYYYSTYTRYYQTDGANPPAPAA